MKFRPVTCSLFAAACFLTFAPTNAAIILTDDFSYSDGNLVDSGNWSNHSGTGSLVQVLSGEVILAQGGGSREDVNRSLGVTMSAGDIFRYEFDVTVTGTVAASNVYFAHFKDSGTGFNARAFVAAPVDGGDFTFGIADTTGTPDATFTSDFSYGTTYRLFGEYNFDTGLSALWINDPSTKIFSENADVGQAMEAFAFRQAGGNTGMVIDNLVITAVPEPGSFAVLGIITASGVAARFRRRHKVTA